MYSYIEKRYDTPDCFSGKGFPSEIRKFMYMCEAIESVTFNSIEIT